MKIIKRQLSILRRFEWFRLQVLTYARILSLNIPFNRFYNEIYGDQKSSGPPSATLVRLEDEPPRLFRVHAEDGQHFRSANFSDPHLNPRYCLQAFRCFEIFRLSSTIWMIYILIRDPLLYIIGPLAEKYFGVELSLHCHLVGRYILQEGVSRITAFMFAMAHLSWRSTQLLATKYDLSMMNFWLLSKSELDAVYERLDMDQQIELPIDKFGRLHPRDRFLLETFCYQINMRSGVVFKLRSNRTRESHFRMRLTAPPITLAVGWIFVTITTILSAIFTVLILSDLRYLREYPNCDSYMERLSREGQLSRTWSATVSIRRFYAALADGFENVFMWLEGGLVSLSAPCYAFIFNRDLHLQWIGIDRKMDYLRSMIKVEKITPGLAKRTIIGRSGAMDTEMRELLAELVDFFDQFRKADALVSTFLNGCLIASLVMCASYTYYVQEGPIDQVPISFTVVIAVLVMGMALSCYGSSFVHRLCVNSYPKFCSLMAYDSMKHKHNYGMILDFFVMKRSCFTLMNRVPFRITTFLAMIGWTFSCFCIIYGLLRDNKRHAAPSNCKPIMCQEL